jgi:ligand-binding sensor domain-containing protein/two-component sensor histidine kinase
LYLINYMGKRIIIFFFCLLTCIGLKAQVSNFRFINFGAKEGLTDNFAYNATQDKLGYMWFATPSGLYRYDGHVFKIFRSPIDKPGRAISNILQTVFTAKNGTLWLGGFNTLQWYNPVSNIFKGPDYNQPEIKKLCDAYIFSFAEDKYNNIWIATANNYIFKFNAKDSAITALGSLYPAGASTGAAKIIIAGNTVWAVHSEGLYQFSLDAKYLGHYQFATADISNAVYDKASNSIIITTFSQGVATFNLTNKEYKYNFTVNGLLRKNNLFCINNDDENNVWIGSYPLFKINAEKNNLTTIESKKENEFDLRTSKIGSIYTDREKNIWICGYSGLSMLPWQNQQIETVLLKDKTMGVSVEPVAVYNIANTANLVFANTNTNGLIYYNVLTGEASTIPNNFGKNKDKKRIKGIVQSPDGGIYASDDVHFFKFSNIEKRLIPFSLADQNGNPIVNAGRNVFDKKGNVYISSINNGFYIWNTGTNKLIHYNKWDADSSANAQADNILYPCLTDANDNIWFTSNTGVFELKTNENKFYHHADKEYKGVPPLTTSNFIAQDKLGHYWIATNNNGLYELFFEAGKERLLNYTQNSGIGLPSDFLVKIKPDLKDSTLWISFNAGLLKFDPVHKKVITIFKKQNGLSADEGGYSFNITPDNKLIQLHYGSMNIIDLNTYRFNTAAPNLAFNSIKVFDNEKLYTLDKNKPLLSLKHNENFLQFEFAALAYNNSSMNQYAYMLEGADKEWVYCGSRNFVSYSGLSGGEYIFKVKAANNDGVWSEKELRLKIAIHPVFYKTWWFIALCLLLFFVLIYSYNRLQIKQVKKEENLKTAFQQQIAQTEMKALRAQMNPHFIFNSLNSIQKYILQNDHFAASQYLTRFSRLIRLILDHSNQNNILLNSELDLLKLYIEMEGLRFDNKFNYEIKVDTDINTDTTEVPSMLIQPYIENAIWHGLLHKEEKGNLLVAFKKGEANNLTVTIQDDGIGRQKAADLKSKQVLKKKSYGMQITEDRIQIINQTQNINATCTIEDLKDEHGKGAGTKVILTIPFKPLNY